VKPSSANAQHRRPYLLIGTLVATWLLLNQTLATGHIVLGFVLALALAWATRSLRPIQPRIRRVYLAIGLLPLWLADIVRSNIGVARIVLGLRRRSDFQSGFVKIPLAIRDPHGVAVIAVIVTSTPGTVWVDLSADGSVLTLHVLELRDEAEWVDWLKNRYEKRLMEIFE
jgi:multicomponent K+:H+ antiporter subunit E